MIKIYDLLFEEDTTTNITTSSTANSGEDIGKTIKSVLDPFMKKTEEQNNRITSYLDNVSKGMKKSPPPTSPATTSTSGTVPSGPSKPAGMGTPNSSNKPTSQQLSPEDIKSIADQVSQKISQGKK